MVYPQKIWLLSAKGSNLEVKACSPCFQQPVHQVCSQIVCLCLHFCMFSIYIGTVFIPSHGPFCLLWSPNWRLILLVLDPGAVLVISQVAALCVPKFLMLWLTF